MENTALDSLPSATTVEYRPNLKSSHATTAGGESLGSQALGEGVAQDGGEAVAEEGVVAAEGAVPAGQGSTHAAAWAGGGGGKWGGGEGGGRGKGGGEEGKGGDIFCMWTCTANASSKAARGKGAGCSASGTCAMSAALPLTLVEMSWDCGG